MRCPKCGAFMQEDKDTCLMCGTNVKTYIPETNPNAMFSSSNSSAFGSGNDFRTGAFSGNQSPVNNMNNVNNFGNKGPFKPAPVKKEDKDIFDYYQENKGLFTMLLVIFILGIVALSGYFYYNAMAKEVKLEPVIQNLYFTVDDSFNALASNGNSTVSYAKSGVTGNDCMITVSVGTSASGNHVDDFFYQTKGVLEPEKDSSNSVINSLDIYTPAEGSASINGATWHYLNIFYRDSAKSDPILLKNRYLTSMDKGFYYDITLINFSNDAVCSASLDNFAKSLKFIE